MFSIEGEGGCLNRRVCDFPVPFLLLKPCPQLLPVKIFLAQIPPFNLMMSSQFCVAFSLPQHAIMLSKLYSQPLINILGSTVLSKEGCGGL